MRLSGILLINLGTPASPEPRDVGRYLRQFLMDRFVVDIPFLFRWLLVHLLIVPRRRHTSGRLYRNIWTDEGSPLLVNSDRLLTGMRASRPDDQIALAMRYGQPSIASGLKQLLDAGVDNIQIVPLYPHYALSSVETCLEECRRQIRKLNFHGRVTYFREFYDHPAYINVLVSTIREVLEREKPDFLLYSYHGLPEHQVAATGSRCRFDEECCRTFRDHSPRCYRAQCFETTRLCNDALGWPEDKFVVSFQSRLGRRPWLKPYTDQVLKGLVARGVRRLAVACPAFTADCLETLEEISFRARADFIAAGGEDVVLIPSLNDRSDWVGALGELLTNGQASEL